MERLTPQRFDIVHRTAIHYGGPVLGSYNAIRLTPIDTRRQVVVEHGIVTRPQVVLTDHRDYWGTWVHHFDLHDQHDRLDIVARTRVDTTGVEGTADASWDALASPDVVDRWSEFVLSTPLTAPDAAIFAAADEVRREATPLDAVVAAIDWVRSRLVYQQGVTTVSSTATEVVAKGRGVCQDFSHLTIAVLREAGVPARYVSGYLHPDPEPRVGVAAVGESHAWVEAWLGDWIGFDPTSGGRVDARFVEVARGRDYADVAPLAGVYHGAPTRHVDVSVEITRIR